MFPLKTKNPAVKGYSSAKRRRTPEHFRFRNFLDRNTWAGIFLLLGTAVLILVLYWPSPLQQRSPLQALETDAPSQGIATLETGAATESVPPRRTRTTWIRMEILGTALRISLLLAAGIGVLSLQDPTFLERNRRILLFSILLLLGLGLAKAILTFAPRFYPEEYALFLVPFSLPVMLATILLGSPAGVGITLLFSSFLSMSSASPIAPLLLGLPTGIVAILGTRKIRRRSDLLRAGLLVGLLMVLAALALHSPENRALRTDVLLRQCGIGLSNGILCAVLVGNLLPAFEYLFRTYTNVTLLEFCDLNHPLLKRLMMEAPGSYHHSMLVAHMSEVAADAIGANGLMCRVGAYFHDIGKVVKPGFFVENLRSESNPHDALVPTMSAIIIISHVKEGMDLAIQYRLNSRIIDFIREHHGTTLVNFFFHRAQELAKDQAGNTTSTVDPSSFRYPGPIPQTKETAIVALADTLEAASRTLKKPTIARIEALINRIVEERYREGQFDDCALTLKELATIRETLARTLASMMHNRVEYPDSNEASDRKDTPSAAHRPEKASEPVGSSDPVGSRPGSVAGQ
ncbi:MAG: HD family phosphohydrolase [Verrucomicrobiota bacterium]|jgi:putative nucleotidyltransferase with HDIG domain